MNVLNASRARSGTQWRIAADGHEAVVVEVGGGLRAYRVDGVDHIDGYAEDEPCPASAGQVLAPWPNRIRDGRYTFGGAERQLALTEPARHNAMHGLVNWASWRLAERTDDSVTVQCDLYPQPGYAWPLLLCTRWSVGAGGLRADHEVTNVGTEPAPFGFAVHPYLWLPGVPVDDLVLRIPARSRVLLDGRNLPIGAVRLAGGEYDFGEPRRIGPTVLDTGFGDVEREPDGTATVRLATQDGARSVSLWADEAFGWFQVFTGDPLGGERHRRSVAVEPMTCPPDAFRSGRDLIVLEPGRTWHASWGIRP